MTANGRQAGGTVADGTYHHAVVSHPLLQYIYQAMPTNPEQLFSQAIKLQQCGNLAGAERLCLQILTAFPNNFAVFHLLGTIRTQQGRHPEALELIGAAIKINPQAADALSNYGNVLKELGRFDEALSSYDAALAIKADYAEAHYNRGNTLRDLKRLAEAIQSYDRAIAVRPDLARAYNNKGNTLQDLRCLDEALQNYDLAIGLDPAYAVAYNNRANVLLDLKRPLEALESCDRAIALKPNYAVAYSTRGNALTALERPEEALASCSTAITLNPDFAEAYNNHAAALVDLNRLDEALISYDKAIALKPDFADAHQNQSLVFLAKGQFEIGWRQYEWRKKLSEPLGFRTYKQSPWLGEEEIAGKTLFIYAEQGLGDTIQFCRYLALAKDKGAKVIFSAQDALVRLLQGLRPTAEIVSSKETPGYFDYHVGLLSMPLAFQTDQNSIPVQIPYLRAESDLAWRWNGVIGNEGFKVGICWQANKQATNNIGRSFPLSCLESLSTIPGVRLISLQKGGQQFHDLPSGMKVESFGGDFDVGPDAFIDTAALMENLDLIISCDTAVAHLAGALGRPSWLALKYGSDWRWFLDRSDSPWYPTMRLFRQKAHGDWLGLFTEMRTQLKEMAAQK